MKYAEEIEDEMLQLPPLINIGNNYRNNGDLDNAIQYHRKVITLNEKMGIKRCGALNNLGFDYQNMGEYDKALTYYNRSMKIANNLGENQKLYVLYYMLGHFELEKENYKQSLSYFKKSRDIALELGFSEKWFRYYHLYLSLLKKIMGIAFNEKKVLIHINNMKKGKELDFIDNYYIYQLLEEKSYIKTAYNEIQETAGNLEPDVAAKFLSYPIPKAIVEEWEKVK